MKTRRVLVRGPWCAGVLGVLGAAGAAAGGDNVFVEDFEKGTNVGGWTYGIPQIEVIETEGGNPGAWLHSTCEGLDCLDTFTPQARTTELGSPFTGDYRAAGVVSVGYDAQSLFAQFNYAGRPMTVILWNSDDELVYFMSPTQTAPLPEDGWVSYDFDVPSQSTTLPDGWSAGSEVPPEEADEIWNRVITDVAQLMFFWGNPENFFIFQQWEPGMDNMRIAFSNGKTCAPDWNNDGELSSEDFFAFLNDFFAGDADYDASGETSSEDFFAFLNDFFAGC